MESSRCVAMLASQSSPALSITPTICASWSAAAPTICGCSARTSARYLPRPRMKRRVLPLSCATWTSTFAAQRGWMICSTSSPSRMRCAARRSPRPVPRGTAPPTHQPVHVRERPRSRPLPRQRLDRRRCSAKRATLCRLRPRSVLCRDRATAHLSTRRTGERTACQARTVNAPVDPTCRRGPRLPAASDC